MGLLDRVFPRRQNGVVSNYFRLLNGYTPVFRSFGGGIYESELVRAAIDAKARHISKLKVEPRGTAKPKLSTQLKKAPNDWQTWTQFLYRGKEHGVYCADLGQVRRNCGALSYLSEPLGTCDRRGQKGTVAPFPF